MKATIYDYGVGNLHSLRKALEHVGLGVSVCTDRAGLQEAERIVLPGVGAFGPAADTLAPAREALEAHWRQGTPILGICLGMQLLFEGSEEAPEAHGLGWVAGHVRRMTAPVLPAIGWNTVHGEDPVVGDGQDYYFVHSFAAPQGPACVGTAEYGQPFAAAVRSGSALGLQFHPEKSSAAGLALLARWRDA